MEQIPFTSVQQLREVFAAGDAVRDAGLVWPENILVMRDLAYGPDPVWNLLDIVYPQEELGKLSPVIVSVHGGGWVYGDRKLYSHYCAELAKHGFAVVNFEYHLAPESPWPAALRDVIALFEWIRTMGYEHGIDAAQLFAVGDSAGAQLLAQYIAMAQNPKMQIPELPMPPEPLVPQAIALNCGCYDMRPSLTAQPRGVEAEAYVPEVTGEILEAMDTMKYLTEAFPPVFLMTSAQDFLREQAQPMFRALQRAGVPVVFKEYRSEDRELGHVFHLQLRLPEAQQCTREEIAFFKGFLHDTIDVDW